MLAAQGARPADEHAADELYARTWAQLSLDVHALAASAPQLMKTIVPASAEAMLSVRLAPGQTLDEIVPTVERLLREGAPPGAEVEVTLLAGCDPGRFDAGASAIALAADASSTSPTATFMPPDERLRVEHLDLGVAAARELFRAWGSLSASA